MTVTPENAHLVWMRERQRTPSAPPPRSRRADYHAYLESPEWQQRRRLVMERCAGVCEACGVAEATEVHHTTYQHVGNEPLWELRGVCRACHESITEMDRRGRK